MAEFKPFTIERPWGHFRQFSLNSPSTIKIHTILPNASLSLQRHTKRAEFWHVISGSGIIEVDEEKFNVREGDEHGAKLGAHHRIEAGEHGLVLLEVATGEFDEEDIVRYEDKYGRV